MRCQRTAFKFRFEKILRSFYGFKAAGANVIVYNLAFRVDVRHFLNVGFERPSRSSFGMAYVISRSLTLSAYAANSRHIIHPPDKVKLLK